MRRGKLLWAFLMFFAATMLLASPSYAVAPTFATNTTTQSGVAQGTLNGFEGVEANFTSSINLGLSFCYVDLVNSAGQTVFVGIGSVTLPTGQKTVCFASLCKKAILNR